MLTRGSALDARRRRALSLLRLAAVRTRARHRPRRAAPRGSSRDSRRRPLGCSPRFRSPSDSRAPRRPLHVRRHEERMAPKTKIGTHDGSFHCDEALGCLLLHADQGLRGRDDRAVARSRGSPVRVRRRHRRRRDVRAREVSASTTTSAGFEEVFGHGLATKLSSSAGLVYKHFGREIVANVLGLDEKDAADPSVEKVYLKSLQGLRRVPWTRVDNGVQHLRHRRARAVRGQHRPQRARREAQPARGTSRSRARRRT